MIQFQSCHDCIFFLLTWVSRAIKSPQVLELSGIGNPKILEKVGIDVNIDLPGVGENVQEHYGCSVTYELNPDVPHVTIDLFREPGYAEKAKELQLSFFNLNKLYQAILMKIAVLSDKESTVRD